MKRIIHISDLHFGTENPTMLALLADDIIREKPDIIIMSGDFTQRALHYQFQLAQDFIKSLSNYQILCVPGNHDISLHNLIERFAYPFAKYKKYIHENLNSQYQDSELAILGINSVTPFHNIRGHISSEQLTYIKDYFQQHSNIPIKIVVMHHNLIRSKRHKIILNAETLIETLALEKVNIILSGHLHYAVLEQLQRAYVAYPMYVITAGTAVSKRLRQGQNSYNIIEIDNQNFRVLIREYDKKRFTTISDKVFPLQY